jgi:hypothetical protein
LVATVLLGGSMTGAPLIDDRALAASEVLAALG